nr:FCD domain-containing protein [Spirochaetales bacterium]
AYNRRFHKIIIKACGNMKLIEMIRDNVSFLKYWFIQLSTPEETSQRNKAHQKILKAMENKEAKLARSLMEEHVFDSLSDLLKRIQASNPNLVSLDHKIESQEKEWL